MDQDLQKDLYPHLWSNSGFLEEISASVAKKLPECSKTQQCLQKGKKKLKTKQEKHTDKHQLAHQQKFRSPQTILLKNYPGHLSFCIQFRETLFKADNLNHTSIKKKSHTKKPTFCSNSFLMKPVPPGMFQSPVHMSLKKKKSQKKM